MSDQTTSADELLSDARREAIERTWLEVRRGLNDGRRSSNGCGALTCWDAASVYDCRCYREAEAMEKAIQPRIDTLLEGVTP